jgi:hypothetical protein
MLRFEREEIAQTLLCMWVVTALDPKASIGRWETFRYRGVPYLKCWYERYLPADPAAGMRGIYQS